MSRNKKYRSFVALFSVIMVSAIIIVSAIGILIIQSSRILSESTIGDSHIAKLNAQSCVEAELGELKQGGNLGGVSPIEMNNGVCEIIETQDLENGGIIKSKGEYRDSLYRLRVEFEIESEAAELEINLIEWAVADNFD